MTVLDPGVEGSAVTGKQLSLSRVFYTGNNP